MSRARSLAAFVAAVVFTTPMTLAAATRPAAATDPSPGVDPLVVAVGDAQWLGDPAGLPLAGPLVSIAATTSGNGYWIAGSDGGVFAYGDAPWMGSIPQVLPPGTNLAEPIVELIATPADDGYWLVASDGGVFAFGAARWFGSIPQVLPPGVRLAAPIAAAAAHPTGGGYWLLGADGGVFTFGNAAYHGSVPERRPATPFDAVAIVPTPTGSGYTIHGRDGSVESFGDAPVFSNRPAPAADADWTPFDTIFATTTGTVDGTTSASVEPGSGIASVAATRNGGWVLRNGVGPVVSVWQSGGLSSTSRTAAQSAATNGGAQWTVSHGGAIDYVSTRRRGAVVDAAPSGWRLNWSAIALDAHRADVLVGGPSARSLARGEVVVGRRAADRHGIQRGDVIELFGWNGMTRFIPVGHVAESVEIGNVEIAMSTATAAELGFSRPSAVLMWSFDDARLEPQLAALPPERWLTVNRSWIPTGRDRTLATTVLKDLAGEPAYLPGGPGDPVIFRQSWIDEHIIPVDLPILGTIRCHRVVAEPLIAVFAAIEAQGLTGAIDVDDTRRHGGCFYPRVIRGSSGGSLSRHSWGVAIDVNPRTNAFGATPTIDPAVVEIFRDHGFAWGGSWVRPDGMHFEWTGS